MATLSDSQTNGNPETVLEDLRVTSDRCDKNKRKKETAKQRKAPAVTKAEEEEELLNKLIAENRAKELERKADLVPRWEIKPTQGKGNGMFATRDIPKGTEIFCEAPLIIGGAASLSREAVFVLLSKKKKKACMGLEGRCHCPENPCHETEVQRIWQTNSFPITARTQDGQTVLYDNASRINHSCVANGTQTFTRELNIIFWATKDIKNGEEITRNYGVEGGPAEQRQQKLTKGFSFKCVCEVCLVNKDLPYKPAEEDIEVVKMIEETLKNGTPVTKIFKERTPEQFEAEKTVKEWLFKIRLVCNDLAKQVIQSTVEACNQPVRTRKAALHHALQNSLELWGMKIRDHNKIKHGGKAVQLDADVLKKYMTQFDLAFGTAMGELVETDEPLLVLARFWCKVHDSLKYEFSGQKPPKNDGLWLQSSSARIVIKRMQEESAAPKAILSRITPPSADDVDHLVDIPLAFTASKDETVLKNFTAPDTPAFDYQVTLKGSTASDASALKLSAIVKILADAKNEAAPEDSTRQDSLTISKDEGAPNIAALKLEATLKDEAVLKYLAASKDGVAPKGSAASNMTARKGLAAPNVATLKVLIAPAMAATQDSVAFNDLADLMSLNFQGDSAAPEATVTSKDPAA